MGAKKDQNSDIQEQDVCPAFDEDNVASQADKILEDAYHEAEKILSEAKNKANEEMKSDKKSVQEKESSTVDSGNELVTIRLFKDGEKYKDDVFVAVNGESVQIKRGETVRIKKKFADVLEQSMAQDTATANLIERESSRYEAEAKARNL